MVKNKLRRFYGSLCTLSQWTISIPNNPACICKNRNGDGYHGCFYKLLTLLYATVVTPDLSELTLLQAEIC